MNKVIIAVLALLAAATVSPAVFERYLSPERPADRAILAYLELAKTDKATSRDLAELGVLLLDKGFPVDAEHFLRKALDLDETDFEAEYRLGLVLQRTGQYRAAIRAYRSVVKQRPGHAYARFMLATAEERAGRRHAAIKDYAKAYRFAPELAVPEKNPLVFDSELQNEAMILHYRNVAQASTLRVTAIDPAAVQRMMSVKPTPQAPVATPATPPPPPSPTPRPAPAPTPARPGAATTVVPPAAPPGRGVGPPRQQTPPPPAPVNTGEPAPSLSSVNPPGTPMLVVRNVSGTA